MTEPRTIRVRVEPGAGGSDLRSALSRPPLLSESPRFCQECGARLATRPGSGRQPDYCDDACRQAAYRERTGRQERRRSPEAHGKVAAAVIRAPLAELRRIAELGALASAPAAVRRELWDLVATIEATVPHPDRENG